MKKKISVFALLLSLMLSLVIPVQAKAYTVSFPDFPVEVPYEYFYIKYNGYGSSDLILVGSDVPFTFDGDNVVNEHKDFLCSMWKYASGTNYWNTKFSNAVLEFIKTPMDLLLCSNHDILDSSGSVVFEKNHGPYLLTEWCEDAGLNCAASSNESSTVIPFWYEPAYYNYIVRKTLNASSTSGIYQLTMIQKTDGQHYPYYFESNDGIGYLGLAGSFTDATPFTFRNFYYDSEGDGWKLVKHLDISVLPFDITDVYFSDNVVFIYSDTDIYANREASSVWQMKSKTYYNVDIPEPDNPTPTPTSIPSSGGGRPGSGTRPDTGGQVTGGGGLDFIINLFTLIWTKICSIPMVVDGYSINLQQIVIYGALVSIVGGFIMHFIFGRK